jgi:hypothetical protein
MISITSMCQTGSKWVKMNPKRAADAPGKLIVNMTPVPIRGRPYGPSPFVLNMPTG